MTYLFFPRLLTKFGKESIKLFASNDSNNLRTSFDKLIISSLVKLSPSRLPKLYFLACSLPNKIYSKQATVHCHNKQSKWMGNLCSYLNEHWVTFKGGYSGNDLVCANRYLSTTHFLRVPLIGESLITMSQ